jgi:hypothetical protein
MAPQWRWFDRSFTFDFPVAKSPDILERYRGTPARLDERTGALPRAVLTRHDAPGTWSILQNVGHLLDLEPLWERRLDDYLAGRETLSPADLTNAATNTADHESRQIADLLGAFRVIRGRIVTRLERVAPADWARVAVHPRLKQPLRLVDAIAFTCDHDDYHLARISELLAPAR